MTDLQRLHDDADRDGIQKIVVGALVHSQGRILILRRSRADPFMAGIEELPSGAVEPGEDLLAALTRELAEEIGWNGPLSIDPYFVASFDYISGSGRKTRQYTFAAPDHGHLHVTLSAEHDGYRWIRPADLEATDLTDETAQAIRAWATSQHKPDPPNFRH